MTNEKEITHRLKLKALNYVAFWQFMGFGMLLCLVWVNETMDLPNLFFGIEHSELNIFRACVMSAAVLLCAVIVVGNSYIQQKHIIQGLLTVCSSCHKIKINEKAWKEMDEYVSEHSLAAFSHGLCPDCFDEINDKIDAHLAENEAKKT